MKKNTQSVISKKSKFLVLFFLIQFIFYSNTFTLQSQQLYADYSKEFNSVLLSESFDNNNNKWITDNLWIKGEITNGSYHISCKNYMNSAGLSFIPVNFDKEGDYEIETSFRNIKGSGGLVFGMDSNYDHYRIEILKNKLFILKNTPSTGKNEELYSVSVISYLNQGSVNKITIRKFRDLHYIFLNEKLIKDLNNIKASGNNFGFNVGLNSEIIVDYLNITDINKKNTQSKSASISSQKSISEIKEEPGSLINSEETILSTTSFEHPVINWISPASKRTNHPEYSARVKAKVKSSSEISTVVFYVNGVSKGEAERKIIPGDPGNYLIEKVLNFDSGENVVYFTITNQKLNSEKSEERYFIIPEATKPSISWSFPALSNVSVNEDRVNIEVCISSPSGLKSIKVLVNGEVIGGNNVFRESYLDNCQYKWQYPVILKENSDNSIVVIAENAAGSIPSESRIIRYTKASVEKRIALVLGNSDYGNKPPLKNPVQDANLMEATLEKLGFTVIKKLNLELDSMTNAIRDFSQKIKSYNVALFYYAGHGVQIDGKNYLIPIDAKLESKDDCEWEAFAVDDLLSQFEKNQKNVNIAILDACRSNPFTSWVRGESAGFVPLTKTSGMFISFATAPGSTAADGNTGNGLFTEELVKQMNIPQTISSVFLNTRINVYERSNKTQRPQEWNDLNGEFYFKK